MFGGDICVRELGCGCVPVVGGRSWLYLRTMVALVCVKGECRRGRGSVKGEGRVSRGGGVGVVSRYVSD